MWWQQVKQGVPDVLSQQLSSSFCREHPEMMCGNIFSRFCISPVFSSLPAWKSSMGRYAGGCSSSTPTPPQMPKVLTLCLRAEAEEPPHGVLQLDSLLRSHDSVTIGEGWNAVSFLTGFTFNWNLHSNLTRDWKNMEWIMPKDVFSHGCKTRLSGNKAEDIQSPSRSRSCCWLHLCLLMWAVIMKHYNLNLKMYFSGHQVTSQVWDQNRLNSIYCHCIHHKNSEMKCIKI